MRWNAFGPPETRMQGPLPSWKNQSGHSEPMLAMDACFRQAWRPDISGNTTIFNGDEPVASDFDKRPNGKHNIKGQSGADPT